MTPEVANDDIALPFAEICETYFHCCTNTGRKQLVRTGRLRVFKVGRHLMSTPRAAKACQALLEVEAARATAR